MPSTDRILRFIDAARSTAQGLGFGYSALQIMSRDNIDPADSLEESTSSNDAALAVGGFEFALALISLVVLGHSIRTGEEASSGWNMGRLCVLALSMLAAIALFGGSLYEHITDEPTNGSNTFQKMGVYLIVLFLGLYRAIAEFENNEANSHSHNQQSVTTASIPTTPSAPPSTQSSQEKESVANTDGTTSSDPMLIQRSNNAENPQGAYVPGGSSRLTHS